MSIEIRKIMDETLFRNVGEDGFVKAPDYAKVEGLEKMLDIMSDVGPHNSYITDYYMKRTWLAFAKGNEKGFLAIFAT